MLSQFNSKKILFKTLLKLMVHKNRPKLELTQPLIDMQMYKMYYDLIFLSDI